jgi:hypothetical protein
MNLAATTLIARMIGRRFIRLRVAHDASPLLPPPPAVPGAAQAPLAFLGSLAAFARPGAPSGSRRGPDPARRPPALPSASVSKVCRRSAWASASATTVQSFVNRWAPRERSPPVSSACSQPDGDQWGAPRCCAPRRFVIASSGKRALAHVLFPDVSEDMRRYCHWGRPLTSGRSRRPIA